MKAEIARLEVALAHTERLWRQEKQRADLLARILEAKAEANDCGRCRKLLCLVPCPAGERGTARIVRSAGGRI